MECIELRKTINPDEHVTIEISMSEVNFINKVLGNMSRGDTLEILKSPVPREWRQDGRVNDISIQHSGKNHSEIYNVTRDILEYKGWIEHVGGN